MKTKRPQRWTEKTKQHTRK